MSAYFERLGLRERQQEEIPQQQSKPQQAQRMMQIRSERRMPATRIMPMMTGHLQAGLDMHFCHVEWLRGGGW